MIRADFKALQHLNVSESTFFLKKVEGKRPSLSPLIHPLFFSALYDVHVCLIQNLCFNEATFHRFDNSGDAGTIYRLAPVVKQRFC